MSIATLLTRSGVHTLRTLSQGHRAADDLLLLSDELPELKLEALEVPDVSAQPVWAPRNMPAATHFHLRRRNAVWTAPVWHTAGLMINLDPRDPIRTFVDTTYNSGWTRVDKYGSGSCVDLVERKHLAYAVRNSIYAPKEAGVGLDELKGAFDKGVHAEALAARLTAFALEHRACPFTSRLRPPSANDSYLYLYTLEGPHGQNFSIRTVAQMRPFCRGGEVNNPALDPVAVVMVGPASLRYGCALLAALGRVGGPCHGQRHALMQQFDTGMEVLLVGNGRLAADWPAVQAADFWRAIHEAVYILQVYNNVDPVKMNAWAAAMIDNFPILDTTSYRETHGAVTNGFWNTEQADFTNFATNGDAGVVDRFDNALEPFRRNVPGFRDLSAVTRRGIMASSLADERDDLPLNTARGCEVVTHSRNIPQPLIRLLVRAAVATAHIALPNGDPLPVAGNEAPHPHVMSQFAPTHILAEEWGNVNIAILNWGQVHDWMWGLFSGRDTYIIYGTHADPDTGWAGAERPEHIRLALDHDPLWPAAPPGHSWAVLEPDATIDDLNRLANVRIRAYRWISEAHRPALLVPESDAVPRRFTTGPARERIMPAEGRDDHNQWLQDRQPIMHRAAVNANVRGRADALLNPSVDNDGNRVARLSHRIGNFLSGWGNAWWLTNGPGAMNAARNRFAAQAPRCTSTCAPDEAFCYLGGQHGLTPLSHIGGAWVLAVAAPGPADEGAIVRLSSTFTWLEDQELYAQAVLKRRVVIEQSYAVFNVGPANVQNSEYAHRELPANIVAAMHLGATKSREIDPDSMAKFVRGMAQNAYPDKLGTYLQRIPMDYDSEFRHGRTRMTLNPILRWHYAFVRPSLISQETWAWMTDTVSPTRVPTQEVRNWLRSSAWQSGAYVNPEGNVFPGHGYHICSADEALFAAVQTDGRADWQVQAWSPRATGGMYRIEAPQELIGRWLNTVETLESRFCLPYEQTACCVVSMDDAAAKRGLADWAAVKRSMETTVYDISVEVAPGYNYVMAPYENNINGAANGGTLAEYHKAMFRPFAYSTVLFTSQGNQLAFTKAMMGMMERLKQRGKVQIRESEDAAKRKEEEQNKAVMGKDITVTSNTTVSTLTAASPEKPQEAGNAVDSTTKMEDGTTSFKSAIGGGTQPTGDGAAPNRPAPVPPSFMQQFLSEIGSMSAADKQMLMMALGGKPDAGLAPGSASTTDGSSRSGDTRGGTLGGTGSSRADFT